MIQRRTLKKTARTKSERSALDQEAALGLGCTREDERIRASFGEIISVSPQFACESDLGSGGVLLALPSLLTNGLLKFSGQYFKLPPGYYGLDSILIVLAFMALLRIKSPEGLRYRDPGELGKLAGLDRAPEARTLREKLSILTNQGDVEGWERQLSVSWMEDNPDLAGALYVDGHVRVYHGHQTKLPKRYVAREKLCLRGVTDYWVNDAVGQPFFVVSKAFNQGLLAVLRDEIAPRLLNDVPNQPSSEALENDRYLHRFSMIFDREGYSPVFFKEMWENRIACYTYRKYAKQNWPLEEFVATEVVFPHGEVAKMKLAERGLYYKKEKLWVRQIRKLTSTGHQTALISSNYKDDAALIAGQMFSRWSQENFFKYMRQHYGIDKLINYDLEMVTDPIKVVNPRYRELDSSIRSKNAKLSRSRAKYGALVLEEEADEGRLKKLVNKKSELRGDIEELLIEIEALKSERKKTGKHLQFSELPKEDQFQIFKKKGKHFMDAVKMIAYRAETAMANIVQKYLNKKDESRSLVRQILMTDADLEVDREAGLLKVNIHNMTNPRNNLHVKNLCQILNESETDYPGTKLRLVYNLVSGHNHPDQGV